MPEKWNYYYVSPYLTKGWSDDGESVWWCNPQLGEDGREEPIDSLYNIAIPPIREGRMKIIEANEKLFGLLIDKLRAGDKTTVDLTDTEDRNAVLYQYLRALSAFKLGYARYMGSRVLDLMNEYKGLDYYTVIEPSLNTIADHATDTALSEYYALPAMDLKSRMLYAPEGRHFVVGATPVNVINPYFEKRFVKFPNTDKYFILKGTIMILPVSSTSSLCFYDGDIYDFPEGEEKTVLSEGDMDILNKLQIFTSEIDGGIVYKDGDEEYIRKLTKDFPQRPYRTGYEWLRADRYPFWTNLSVLKIKDGAAKNLQKNLKSPIRPYSEKIKEYDSDWEERHGSFKGPDLMIRYEYAMGLLGNKAEE